MGENSSAYRKQSNLCLIYAWGRASDYTNTNFLCVLNFAKRKKKIGLRICYYQPSIQTPNAVTLSYFETLKKWC